MPAWRVYFPKCELSRSPLDLGSFLLIIGQLSLLKEHLMGSIHIFAMLTSSTSPLIIFTASVASHLRTSTGMTFSNYGSNSTTVLINQLAHMFFSRCTRAQSDRTWPCIPWLSQGSIVVWPHWLENYHLVGLPWIGSCSSSLTFLPLVPGQIWPCYEDLIFRLVLL